MSVISSHKSKGGEDSSVKKWGVHILFKQATDSSVILGDSHEYADVENKDTLGFDSYMDIDNFILQESKKSLICPLTKFKIAGGFLFPV